MKFERLTKFALIFSNIRSKLYCIQFYTFLVKYKPRKSFETEKVRTENMVIQRSSL